MVTNSLYEDLGVSAQKGDVHAAIKHLSQGLYPGAFCKILPDIFNDDPDYCIALHADGTGTKSSLAYAYWKETGDLSVMRNIPIDAIVMNLDDLLCIGATGPFLFDQSINRNRHNVPGDLTVEIIRATDAYAQKLMSLDVPIMCSGGETADVGDVVQTFIIDTSMFVRMKRTDVIDRSHISPGDIIVGLSSSGQSSYEDEYNSGIGSNGLTLARHGLFGSYLGEKYPELYDHKNLLKEKVFFGKWRLDEVPENEQLPLGKLVLSPTRTYAPILISFLKQVNRAEISGIIHCSGGGQTKCKEKVSNVRIIKDTLFEPPFIFKELYATGKVTEREMYMDFNMGHRMEVYCKNQTIAQTLISIAKSFNVEAKIIGHCEKIKKNDSDRMQLVIKSWLGNTLEYSWS